MEGSATLTTVLSKPTMNRLKQQNDEHQRAAPAAELWQRYHPDRWDEGICLMGNRLLIYR